MTFHFFAEVHQGDGIFEEDQRLFFHLISSSTSTIWAAVSCVSVASDLNVFSVWSRPRWNRRNMSQVSTNQRRVFPFSSSLSVVFHLHFIVFSKFWLLFYDFCFDLSLSNLFLFFSLFFCLSLSSSRDLYTPGQKVGSGLNKHIHGPNTYTHDTQTRVIFPSSAVLSLLTLLWPKKDNIRVVLAGNFETPERCCGKCCFVLLISIERECVCVCVRHPRVTPDTSAVVCSKIRQRSSIGI